MPRKAQEAKTKKLIFFIVLTVVVVCAGVLSTSLAYFDDVEESTENTFQAGTWGIEVEALGAAADEAGGASLIISNVRGGDAGSGLWLLTNTGTVDLIVVVTLHVREEGEGHLAKHVLASLTGDGIRKRGKPTSTDLRQLSGRHHYLALAAGESAELALNWQVAGDYVPAEGDRVTVTLDFDLKLPS